MEGFYKNVMIICSLVFCLFFLASPSQAYYGGPVSYPYYQPSTNYSLPPINININLGGYPGSYSTSYPNYMSFPPSGYVGGTDPYGNKWMTVLPATAESIAAATSKFSFIHSTSDGEYVYVAFGEAKGQNRKAMAIFETSGSDDLEYLSHITLGETTAKIIIQDDLAIIGAYDGGTVYLVDISNKDKPKLINTLVLGKNYQSGGRSGVTGMAVEDEVLFVTIEFLGRDKNILYSIDISDPEDTDEDDDLLDSYVLDDDEGNAFFNMTSTSGYLYVSGQYDRDYVIFVMDISDPEDISLVEVLDMDDQAVVMTVNGDYLYTALDTSSGGGLYNDGSFELKIIEISDRDDPEIISSSDEFTGRPVILEGEGIVVKENYAYVAVSTRDPSETKVYVFDLSDPEDPVETSKKVKGTGLDLYLIGDNLCLHTTQTMAIFDISDPEDLSVDTIDLEDILEDELEGWGEDRSSSSYYGGYPLYGPMGYSGWGSSTYFGGFGSNYYGSYPVTTMNPYANPSPWTGGSHYYGPWNSWGSGGSGYSGWGGPPYGGYNSGRGYPGWSSWYL